MEIIPAIVLSGHTMALGVVRALGERNIPVIMLHYDERDMGHVSKYVIKSVTTVHPEKDEEQFIRDLINLGSQYKGAVVFPVSDETVVAVSRNKNILKKYYQIACPDWEIARKFIEKKFTYELAYENGIAAPMTIVPKSLADVKEFAAITSYPCLIKPSQSHLFYAKFKCKMFPVENTEQLISLYEQTVVAGLEVMLQEIIPGDDEDVVNYNAFFVNGQPISEFTSQHIRNAPPRWGSPRVVLSKDIPEIIQPGRKIIKAIGYSGYTCTEFKKDARDGIYKLMEVNGRHNLSTLLAVRCGINFPWMEYQYQANGVLVRYNQYKNGIYWIDIPRDVGYSLRFYRQERYRISQYIRPYIKPHVYANLDMKDIRPFKTRFTYLVKQAAKYIYGKLGLGNGVKDNTHLQLHN